MRRIILLVALSSIMMGSGLVMANSVVTVTPTNMNSLGWSTITEDWNLNPVSSADASAGFQTGPATPPIGSGSAHFTIGSNDEAGAIFDFSGLNGDSLSSLNTLSYSTYESEWTDGQAPYMAIGLSNGDALFFEPVYQDGGYTTGEHGTFIVQPDPKLNTWQTWDALDGGWWTNDDNTDGPPLHSIENYIANNPGVTITDFAIQAGFGWAPFDGNFDNVTINNVTYNFDPVSTPLPTSAWSGLALLGGLAGFSGVKRLRNQVA